MADAIVDLIRRCRSGIWGFYRDHKTLKPITYYNKLSAQARLDVCYIVDPMLATGGSAVAALDILKQWNVPHVRYLAYHRGAGGRPRDSGEASRCVDLRLPPSIAS